MTKPSKRQAKSTARLQSVQALFQMEAADQPRDLVRKQFLDHRFGESFEEGELVEADVDLFDALTETALEQQARIDQCTDRALATNWPIDRIDPTIRALFRSAGAELVIAETPPKVVITEFVDIAKAFFPDGREPKFVNAVLDHMARDLRPDKFS